MIKSLSTLQFLVIGAVLVAATGCLTEPIGRIGPQGVSGITGPQGVAGVTGRAGPQGPAGQVGPAGLNGSEGIAGNRGPEGPAGKPGLADLRPGIDGPAGPMGSQGKQGPLGPQGEQGLLGPPGATGQEGPWGPQGAPGFRGPAGLSGLEFVQTTENVNSASPVTFTLSCEKNNKLALFGSAKMAGPVTIHGGSAYPIIDQGKVTKWAVDVSGSGSVTLYVACAYVAD